MNTEHCTWPVGDCACRPASAQEAAPEFATCYVCGGPMDGKSEDDCHCFHRRELAPAPVQAAPTEPVAWRYRHLPTVGWSYSEHRHPRNDLRQEPLYATPAPVAADTLTRYCETCERNVTDPCNSADCSTPEVAEWRITDAQCDQAMRSVGLLALAYGTPQNLAMLRGLCRAAISIASPVAGEDYTPELQALKTYIDRKNPIHRVEGPWRARELSAALEKAIAILNATTEPGKVAEANRILKDAVAATPERAIPAHIVSLTTPGATMDQDPRDMTMTQLLHEFIYISNVSRGLVHSSMPLAAVDLTPERIAAIEAEINRRAPAQFA